MKKEASLKARAIRRMTATLVILAAMLFLSAGSLKFWQGWLFVGLQAEFWTFFFVDFLKNDPQLLERRLQNKKSEPQQKIFQELFSLILIPAFIVTGLDFRFEWTRRWLGPVPVLVVAAGQVGVVAGYWLWSSGS